MRDENLKPRDLNASHTLCWHYPAVAVEKKIENLKAGWEGQWLVDG